MKKYDLSKIMRRAWEFVRSAKMNISSALKRAWKEAKEMAEEAKNVVIMHFESYNARRYSTPWVCKIVDGKHDFSEEVGMYSGCSGDAGDLVVFQPVVGQVYGYGQKDYRRNGTLNKIVKWTGLEFVECDKFGKEF